MKKYTLLIVLLALSMAFLSAQIIADYAFSNTTDGTLQDMTGSSSFTNLTPGTYYDDVASAVTNIGFTFGFGSGAYTQFSVNSNGQLQLGATAISGGAASPALNTPRLAPLSGDNAIRATGKVHYLVTGTAPNRKLVVEWLDLRVPFSNFAETGTYCRMQAWLYETSNNIKFVYGTMWNMSTYTQSRGVYISTSNAAGTVGNVTDIINTMAWTTTANGLWTTTFPASSAMANLDSPTEGARRVFSINYPVYTVPPNPAVLVSPVNGDWAMLDAVLTWQSGGGGATSFDVYFGTSSNPPFVVNQSATSYTPALAPATTYYWNIVARNDYGAAAATATWSFMTPTTTQLVESFEATTFPPAGWVRTTAGSSYWERSTTQYKHGVASMYAYTSTTAAYSISTPRVTITPTSTLDFYSWAGATSQVLQVLYSSDRTSWTQLGSNITHATPSTWQRNTISLATLAGNNYYLAIQSPLQSAGYSSIYVDHVFGPEITPEAPGPVTLSTPADLAVNVNEYPTLTWTAPTTGGVPTGYRLYVGTTNPPTSMVVDQTGLTYTYATPLAYNTTYYWTVKAYNSAGTSAQVAVRSFTTRDNPIITTFPYSVDFSSWLPENWSTLNYLYGGTPTAGGSWGHDDWLNVTNPVNMAAKINLYNTHNSWLVTPPVQVPAGNYELKFDMAYMLWNSLSTPVVPGNQADERVLLVMSDNPQMTNPTTLMEWNNTGSPYVMDGIPASGATYTYPLSGITGTKFFAIYAESTVATSGDNDLMVDNFIIRELPSVPVFVINPTSWDFGPQAVNDTVTKQFIIGNNGGGVIDLSSVIVSGTYYSLSVAPTDMSLAAGESTAFTVQYAPTTTGTHAGNVAITDGRIVTNVPLSGSVAHQVVMTNGSTTLAVGETCNFYDSGAASGDYQSSENYTYTFYPPAGYRITADFSTFYTEAGYDYLVAYDGADATAAVLGEYTGNLSPFTVTATGAMTFVFSSDGSVESDGWTAQISLLAIPTSVPEAVTLNTPANEATNLPVVGFNLTWTPSVTGGTPTSYGVYMSMDETTIYDDYYWQTTNTFFNPTTAATNPLTFAFEQRWYWTIEAVNNDGSAVVEPPNWFQIQAGHTVALPYTQDFGTDGTMPAGWNQTFAGGVASNSWTVTNTSHAGGTPYEMTGTWASGTGITRLISPPINTAGISAFVVAFNTMYNDYGVGITAKLQYSHDLSTWTDSPWSIISGGGNVSGYQSAIIGGLNAPMTYVAWVLDGNHFQFDFWYVDDVAMSLPPAHDVAPLSWDIPVEVVPENTLVTPMVTVGNNGLNAESFDVTCTIGAYTNTQTVVGLAAGQTLQVSFPALTPALWSANNVVVTTSLATDMVAANDTLFAVLICLDLNTNALANNAQTGQYVQFNLSAPSTLTALPNGYSGTYFMSGADWLNGTWKTVEYDDGTLATDNYYQIDPITGLGTDLGDPGQALMGIAYNDNTGVLYGVASTGFLHTMDPLTGLAAAGSSLWCNFDGTSLNLATFGGLMVDIAYDNFTNTMYGIDLGNDCLWVINPATYELTLVGFFGVDLNFSQDAAFDQDNGLLFLTGYSSFGGLYWIDTTYGGAYLVGPLGTNAYELDAFTIPYGELAAAPEVSISGTGLVSWTPVLGAIQYNVYSADDPYGNFTLEASVIGTEYTGLAAAKKFYKVTAVGGRQNISRQPINYSSPLQKAAPVKNNKPNYTNIAR